MDHCSNPPHNVRNMITGFGDPNYIWFRMLPNGHKKWLVGWKDLGVTASWEEFFSGTTMLNTCSVKLQEAVWQGHESVFNQVFDVNREWDGQIYGVR